MSSLDEQPPAAAILFTSGAHAQIGGAEPYELPLSNDVTSGDSKHDTSYANPLYGKRESVDMNGAAQNEGFTGVQNGSAGAKNGGLTGARIGGLTCIQNDSTGDSSGFQSGFTGIQDNCSQDALVATAKTVLPQSDTSQIMSKNAGADLSPEMNSQLEVGSIKTGSGSSDGVDTGAINIAFESGEEKV